MKLGLISSMLVGLYEKRLALTIITRSISFFNNLFVILPTLMH